MEGGFLVLGPLNIYGFPYVITIFSNLQVEKFKVEKKCLNPTLDDETWDRQMEFGWEKINIVYWK